MALVFVLVLALLLAPAAHAKGSAPYRVCGEQACVALEQTPETLVVLDANALRPAPPSSPYYRLDFDAPGVPSRHYVPVGTLVSDDSGRRWYSLYGPVAAVIRRATAGLEPFAPPGDWSDVAATGARTSGWIPATLVLLALASVVGVRKRPVSGTF